MGRGVGLKDCWCEIFKFLEISENSGFYSVKSPLNRGLFSIRGVKVENCENSEKYIFSHLF